MPEVSFSVSATSEVSVEVIGVSFVPRFLPACDSTAPRPSCPWHGVQQKDLVSPRQAHSIHSPAGGQGRSKEAGAGCCVPAQCSECAEGDPERRRGQCRSSLCHRHLGQHQELK